MPSEETEKKPEQPFDPKSWAIYLDDATLQRFAHLEKKEPVVYQGIHPDLKLRKFPSLSTHGEEAVQGFTFYIDQNGLLRECHQNVFREGFGLQELSVKDQRVTFTNSLLYYPESAPFTHTEGPTVSVTTQAEFSPQALSFTGLDAYVVTVGCGLLYQPLRNYPTLGLKPAFGNIKTSVTVMKPGGERFLFANDTEGQEAMLEDMSILFESGEANQRRVILAHPSSPWRAVFEFNLDRTNFVMDAVASAHPVLPTKVTFVGN